MDLGAVEADARTVPWATIERLCLEAGVFPPRYQPLSEAELAALLDRVLESTDLQERRLAQRWRDRYEHGGAIAWRGCSCREHPLVVRVGGRALVGHMGLGDPLPGESGLSWAAGTNLTTEGRLDAAAGRWWLGVTARLSGRVLEGGTRLGEDDPLAWPGWPEATGRPATGRARTRGGAWNGDLPRLMAGVHFGNWSLSAGRAPRTVGPGAAGLTLDRTGTQFPAVTLRRTRPFARSGWWRWLAPEDLLLRVGRVTAQDLLYHVDGEPETRRQHPWYFQWLVGWRPLPWFRFGATHAALAAKVDASLWGDVMRVNFPVTGTPWDDRSAGLVTDRLFALQMEARWRDAPWPVLPSAGGRVYWEYAGTDMLPGDPGGIPRIASPASVVGLTLVDPRWDLGLTYTELRHEMVLWYSNNSFPTGFTHEGWLVGNALGGSGEEVTGRVGLRPGDDREIVLTVARRRWGMPPRTPGTGRGWTLGASLGPVPTPEALLWTWHVEWFREEARPSGGAVFRDDWWRAWVEVALP